MIKKILFLCMTLMILLMPKGPVEAAGITAYEKFISPAYWTEHNADGDKVVLNAAGVEAFNKKIIAASPTVYDMAAYPKTLSGKTVAAYVNTHTDLSDELYREGKLVSDNYKNILRSQTNAAEIPADVTVRYGVTVRRANLRNLPTGEGLFFMPVTVILMLCRKPLWIRARLSLFCIPVLTVIFIMCRRIITVAGCLNLMLPKLTAVPGCVMRSLRIF